MGLHMDEYLSGGFEKHGGDLRTIAFELTMALSYFSVPLMLFHVRSLRPKDCSPIRHIFLIVNIFIIGCGFIHLSGIFAPLHASFELFHKVLEVFTVVFAAWSSLEIYNTIPYFMKMPSLAQLQALNKELQSHKDNLAKMVEQRTQELLQEKARWQTVIEQAPQIMWLKNGETGEVEYSNKKWHQYTGLGVGVPVVNAFHPVDREVCRNAWISGIPKGTSLDYKVRLKSADNNYRWHLVRAMPIRDLQTDKIIQWCGIATDIHDTEMAKELSIADAKRKSQFLAMVSHEMRTPLTGIIGMSTLLGDSLLSASQVELLNNVKISADRLLLLVNNVLDLFKIHNNKVNLNITTFAIGDSVNQALDTVSDEVSRKHISLKNEIDFDKLPSLVQADQLRITQVLGHLLSNAVKFTLEGGQISVAAHVDNSSGRFKIKFALKDTGIGIKEEDMPKLFEQFLQLDGSSTRKFGGTGVGLAISKGLVELMGGRIWCESSFGKGSTFFFTFEAVDASEKPHDDIEHHNIVPLISRPLLYTSSCDEFVSSSGNIIGNIDLATPSPFASPYMSDSESELETELEDAVCIVKPSVLIADDTEMNQKVLKRLLGTIGYDNVDVVSDGAQAVTAISSKPYDIIFMDMEMPVMDGVTAAQQIRMLPSSIVAKQPHIIAVTANAFQEDVERCLSAGMCLHMAKPLKREALKKNMDAAKQIVNDVQKCTCNRHHHHHHRHHHSLSHSLSAHSLKA